MGHLLGYARASTTDQQPRLQVDALERAGCYRVFVEAASGARTDRPVLAHVLDQLRPGDALVVWKLDRLGRSLRHLVDTVTSLAERGVGFRSLQEAIDTTTPGGKLVFHPFAALAELERDLVPERTSAGLAAARAGDRGGRPAVHGRGDRHDRWGQPRLGLPALDGREWLTESSQRCNRLLEAEPTAWPLACHAVRALTTPSPTPCRHHLTAGRRAPRPSAGGRRVAASGVADDCAPPRPRAGRGRPLGEGLEPTVHLSAVLLASSPGSCREAGSPVRQIRSPIPS